MRQKDVQGEERRYFDIAISEFLEASLSLNTLILERPPVTPENNSVQEVDLKELTELAQMALEVATVDTALETKFFVPRLPCNDSRLRLQRPNRGYRCDQFIRTRDRRGAY